MATAVGVRVSSLAPRRSKVRFAPTSFYACGTKRRHPPAPLLLLSNRDPLRWARGWIRPTGGSFSFLERSVFIAPSTSGQSPLCSDVFLCLRHKKTSSARSLAPPLQPRPAALGSRLGPPYGRLFFLPGKIGFHCPFHVGAKSALLRRLFMPAAQKDVIRPLPGSSSPTATHCAGLAVGAALRAALLPSWKDLLRRLFFPEQKRCSPAPQRFVRKLQPSASRQKRSLQRKRPTGGDIPAGNQTVLFPHAPGCIPPPPGSPSPGKKPASLRRNDWRGTTSPRPDFWPNLPRR